MLELGRCLVTFRSLERLVTLFGAGSSFGHVSLFFDYVVMLLSLEIGCRLVMLFVLLGHVSLCGLVTFLLLDQLVTFLSLELGCC